MIEETGKGLMHFIDTYRKLTKIPKAVFKPIQFEKWLKRIDVLMKDRMESEKVDFLIKDNSARKEVIGDEKLLTQVVINLINNAVDALCNSEHKKVRVRIHDLPDGKTQLDVIDNGCGIDRELLDKIFVPFFTTKEHGSAIAELLAQRGYATAMVGKWHLGNHLRHWPTRQGFSLFFGVPHSNDMPGFALYQGEKKIEQPVVQDTLTRRYTRSAIQFIRNNSTAPFFLYLAHTFPHIPLFASIEFAGRSRAGLYGDTVEEIDWSVGQIVATLKSLGLYDNTLILFTSDNGAWWEGSNGAFRGAKGSTWEAGYRVGLVASWPKRIAPNLRSDSLSVNIDLLPTIAAAAGAALPDGREIDGRSLLPLLGGERDTAAPHKYFYYFNNEELAGIRDNKWKLLTRAYYRKNLGAMDKFDQLPGFTSPYWLLFDLDDPHPERYSMAREYPDVVQRLAREMARAERRFRQGATRERQPTYPQ